MKSNESAARLIESDSFPFEFLSLVAERESWRKEIHRPIYHLHKWWAKRLGSIFRGILLGAVLPENVDLKEAFYQKQDFSSVVVFDPFMGSGTTLGEAHKLGCVALGRDINPVACESVRVAFGPLDAVQIKKTFFELTAIVGQRVQNLYRCEDDEGRQADVLYYFWVKQAPIGPVVSAEQAIQTLLEVRHTLEEAAAHPLPAASIMKKASQGNVGMVAKQLPLTFDIGQS